MQNNKYIEYEVYILIIKLKYMTILFLENRKIFSKWSSKTYEYKYNKICDDKRFKVIDIDDNLEDLELDNYNNIIFGWHGIPINKYYNRSKHIYYKKHIHNLETVKQIEKKIKTLLTIKNKSLIVQDMHTQTWSTKRIINPIYVSTN